MQVRSSGEKKGKADKSVHFASSWKNPEVASMLSLEVFPCNKTAGAPFPGTTARTRKGFSSLFSLILIGPSIVGETSEKTYIVMFKRPEINIQPVIAARAEIHGDHLVFLDSDGRLAALFLLEMVQSWDEVSN
jgi:hypothetical protein